MSNAFDVLWLNTSPSLQRFDQPLLTYLSQHIPVAQWQYLQTQDEASSLDVAVRLLHDYLQSCDRPLHLVGHSTSGLVGLLYARQYPDRVRSLTLLAVGAQASLDWISHYYFHLQFLPCGRNQVLSQTIRDLFGPQELAMTQHFATILRQDLAHSPSPHSLLRTVSLPAGEIQAPLLVCGSQNDIVVDWHEIEAWQPWLKAGDRLWQCPSGRHFFQCFYPRLVGDQLLDFWRWSPAGLRPSLVAQGAPPAALEPMVQSRPSSS